MKKELYTVTIKDQAFDLTIGELFDLKNSIDKIVDNVMNETSKASGITQSNISAQKNAVQTLTRDLFTKLQDFVMNPTISPEDREMCYAIMDDIDNGVVNARTALSSGKYGYFLFTKLNLGIEFQDQKIG